VKAASSDVGTIGVVAVRAAAPAAVLASISPLMAISVTADKFAAAGANWNIPVIVSPRLCFADQLRGVFRV
jgi:hypothetical protein